MKKIVIVNNNLHIGGVQKALINLLWNIQDKYEVTLLLFSAAGECRQELPDGISVETVRSAYRFLGMSGNDARNTAEKLGRAFYAAITRLFGRRFAIALMGLGQKKLQGYDAAISYLHNAGDKIFYGGCNDFVLKHIDADKKIAFLHCDHIESGANTPKNNKMYAKFDAIAACSQGCLDSFLQANPALADKARVVTNCHRFEQILEQAQKAQVALQEDKINVVTVARLGKEKGVERAVEAIAQLGQLQEKLHYYIIGDGIQRNTIQQIIDKEGLAGCVTMTGALSNPYGYIQAADLLLIPSYSEAAPLVIGEATCLGTPILTTQTSSAVEMVQTKGYGWVCENSRESICEGLKSLLLDTEKLESVGKKLKNEAFSNENSLLDFYSLVD